MKRLIIHGDPGIRKGAIIEYDGEEVVCFGINRNGEWHGPDKVQLWCTVGDQSEYEDFEKRNFVPHFLDVERVDAEAVEVVRSAGDLAV
ncbi:HAH_0734 family protein [Halopiger djelfimassiliensis]|uniref:HAH_0734 family protein n=1 Tax=Halopiger djelfimassiliensis TaxID=1293047 RepID=UPI0006777810|nr:HAH_0734 family protein [Halopiger djelfimassiliensis]